MNFEAIKKGIKNKDEEIIIQIQNTLIQKDSESLKKLYTYFRSKASKQVLYDYIIILITSIDYIYDEQMNLNKTISFLNNEQKHILKYLFSTGKKLTTKEISLLDDERLSYLPLEDSYPEIIKRINNNKFNYSYLGSKRLTSLFDLLYKNKNKKTLEAMIDNYNFIMEYNNSNIDTSKLLDITMNNEFREKVITSIRFNKELLDNPSLITPYLSIKEVNYLKEDVKINNILLENGLRFDTLDKFAIKNILENIGMFKLYPYITIYEFAESYPDKEELLNNDIFLSIYLDKIDSLKMPNTFLKHLTEGNILSILRNKTSEMAILNIFISANKKMRNELLKDNYIKEILYKTKNKEIYKYLDEELITDILNNKDNLIKDYYDILSNLDKDILLNIDHLKIYNEYLELNKKNKVTEEQKEFLKTTFDLKIEKEKQPKTPSKETLKPVNKEASSKEIEKVYKSLKEKNMYLDDTLNTNFLDSNTIKIKFITLEYITKYKEIQDYIKVISNVLQPNDISNLFKAFEGLDKEYFLPPILKTLSLSIRGKNRKKVGDFTKFFKSINTITPKDWNNIIDYLLYFVPIVPGVIKSNYIPTPKSYKDIVSYENNLKEIEDEFFKHYKLTKEEKYYLINKYSKKNNFINEIYNSKEQELVNRKYYTLKEVYTAICDIKRSITSEYIGKITIAMNNLKKIDNNILNTSFTTYTSKSDYTYLLLNTNNINSYSSYINYLNIISTKLELNIMNNTNILKDGLYYGYTDLSKEEIINENNNVLLINKFTSSTPNPYRLPNFLLIIEKDNDMSLLDQALKTNETFNKKLKIVILNKKEIIINLINKYNKNHSLSTLKEALLYYDSSYQEELNTIKDLDKIKDIIEEYTINHC